MTDLLADVVVYWKDVSLFHSPCQNVYCLYSTHLKCNYLQVPLVCINMTIILITFKIYYQNQQSVFLHGKLILGFFPFTEYISTYLFQKFGYMRAFHLETIHFGESNTLRYMKFLGHWRDQHFTLGY